MDLDCKFCSKVLSRKDLLKNHYQSCHAAYYCSHCGKVFGTAQEFAIHFSYYHQQGKRYKCDLCDNHYDRVQKVIDHSSTAHGGYRMGNLYCELCDKGVADLVGYRRHIKTHSDPVEKAPKPKTYVRKCNFCFMEFTDKIAFSAHKKSCTYEAFLERRMMAEYNVNAKIAKTVYSCIHNDFQTTSLHMALKHVRTEHPGDNACYFNCGGCGAFFRPIQDNNYHPCRPVVHNREKGLNFRSSSDMTLENFFYELSNKISVSAIQNCIRQLYRGFPPFIYLWGKILIFFEGKMYLCQYSDFRACLSGEEVELAFIPSFDSLFALDSFTFCGSNKTAPGHITNCDVCFDIEFRLKVRKNFIKKNFRHKDFKFDFFGDRAKYVWRDGKFVMTEDIVQDFSCKSCSESCPTFDEYIEHSASHRKDIKTIGCPHCGKMFTLPCYLQLHLNVHKPKTLKCEQCPRMFSSESYRADHVRRAHMTGNTFTCVPCGKTFYTQERYSKHERTHNVVVKNFPCEQCRKSFDSNSSLVRHMKVHGVVKIKSHKCQTCGNSFAKLDGLQRHITRTHATKTVKVKSFKCDVCPNAYTSQSSLKRHQVEAHNVKDPNSKKRGSFRCDPCDKNFILNSALEKHVNKVHGG